LQGKSYLILRFTGGLASLGIKGPLILGGFKGWKTFHLFGKPDKGGLPKGRLKKCIVLEQGIYGFMSWGFNPYW